MCCSSYKRRGGSCGCSLQQHGWRQRRSWRRRLRTSPGRHLNLTVMPSSPPLRMPSRESEPLSLRSCAPQEKTLCGVQVFPVLPSYLPRLPPVRRELLDVLKNAQWQQLPPLYWISLLERYTLMSASRAS